METNSTMKLNNFRKMITYYTKANSIVQVLKLLKLPRSSKNKMLKLLEMKNF